MYRKIIIALVMTVANAHEMTPAYPKLETSHIAGVHKASLEMFNRRKDVQFYEVGVFTKNWEPVPFVTAYSIFKLDYLGRVKLDVYLRDEDIDKATYVCSMSKLRNDDNRATVVASKICSKLKS